MGVTYIFGRVGSGKSQYIMKEMKERIEGPGSHPLFLIVPEQFTLQAERDLIEKQDLEGIMRAEVLSFTRLAYRVFSEVGGLTRTPINDIGKNIVIRKIIEEVEDKLTIYKGISRQEGFLSSLRDIFCEFKQQGIRPEDLNFQSGNIDEDSILKMKLSDIAFIYGKFNDYLENRYLDNEDHLNLLIEYIDRATFIKGGEVWIDGFHVYTPQMLKIIEKLLVNAKEVYISFTMEVDGENNSDNSLFQLPWETFRQVKAVAEDLKIEESIIDLNKETGKFIDKSKEIIHLERELFRYPYQPYEKEIRDINIFAASNLYSEIEYVAREIKKLVRDKGYRYRDIAVVSGDFEGYRGELKRSFIEYHIPYFMDEKRNIMDHPIVEFVLSALDIIIKGYPKHEVFRFIKTGFTGLSKDEGEILENYGLQYGIRGKGWLEDFDLGDEDLEDINNSRLLIIKPLKNLQGKIRENKTSKNITRALFEFLQEMEVHEKLDIWIKDLEAEGRFEYVNENAQIWNTMMEIFDQIYEILGDSPISLREYRKLLESGFASCELGVIPSTIDQVLIGNLERSKSHDIRTLFVVGVNDGILPSYHEDEGVLLNHERNHLKELGLELAINEEKSLLMDNFLIYTTFSKPRDSLYLCYALGDEEGRAKRPSILIDRLKKIFPKIEVKSEILQERDNPLRLVSTPRSTFKYLVENLRLYLDGRGFNDLWWDVYDWYFKESSWNSKRDLVLEGLFYQNRLGYVKEAKARSLYSLPIRSSVSRLESFARCPFSHFISYGLRPKERKVFEVEGPDIGRVFHYSMERFAKKSKEQNIDWRHMNKTECQDIVGEVMGELAKEFQHGIMLSTHRYQYLMTRLTQVSTRALWTLLQQLKTGKFEIYGHEVPFGLGRKIPPIIIQLDDGELIYLEGRIDRVDILRMEGKNYFKVIDYKSGNKAFDLSDIYNGLQLQLLVYLEAAMAIGMDSEKNDNYPAGVFYFKIDNPLIKASNASAEEIKREISKELKMRGLLVKELDIIRAMDEGIEGHSDIIPVSINKDGSIGRRSSVATREDFENLIRHIKNLIREISKEMLKGNIKINPYRKGNENSCTYCNYKAICQFDSSLPGYKYRSVDKLRDEEVLKRLRRGEAGDEKLD